MLKNDRHYILGYLSITIIVIHVLNALMLANLFSRSSHVLYCYILDAVGHSHMPKMTSVFHSYIGTNFWLLLVIYISPLFIFLRWFIFPCVGKKLDVHVIFFIELSFFLVLLPVFIYLSPIIQMAAML